MHTNLCPCVPAFSSNPCRAVSISACLQTHPSSIAMRYVQRQILMGDPDWKDGLYYDVSFPRMGMQRARYGNVNTPGMGMQTHLVWECKHTWYGNANTPGMGMQTNLEWRFVTTQMKKVCDQLKYKVDLTWGVTPVEAILDSRLSFNPFLWQGGGNNSISEWSWVGAEVWPQEKGHGLFTRLLSGLRNRILSRQTSKAKFTNEIAITTALIQSMKIDVTAIGTEVLWGLWS